MRIILLCILALAAPTALLCAQDTGSIRTADGFQCPVGPNGTGEGYYVARGYRPNGHLGEDWNGIRGGDTDLGDPIYSIANGLVVFAKNYHVGWGNVVIIRHAYYEGFALKYVDSLYGHLLSFNVQEGDHVKRGQQIGRLGSNSGMYDAHLHLEIRKNLQIGMYRSSFPRDFSNYYSPSQFIAAHRICDRGNRVARAPINTFPATAPPSYAAGAQVYTPVYAPGNAPRNPAITSEPVLAPARTAPERVPEREPEPIVKTTLEPPPTPKPVPATPVPEKKVVVTKPTPTPAPVEKSTPKPKAVAATSTPAPKKAVEDAPTTTASSKTTPKPKTVATSTPAPSKTTAKSSKSTPSATPKPTTSTAKASSTPAPKTAATTKATTPKPTAKTASTPAPKTASTTKETAKPAPAAKEPAAVPAKTTTASAATFRSTVKPPPPTAPVEIDPVEPALPTNAAPPITTPGSPIRRAGSGFRVDRFPDMRGSGY